MARAARRKGGSAASLNRFREELEALSTDELRARLKRLRGRARRGLAERVLAEREGAVGRSEARARETPTGQGAAAAVALPAAWQAALPPMARQVGRVIGIGLTIAALGFVVLRVVRR